MRVCKEIVRLSLANLFGRFLIKRPNWLDGPVRLGLYGIIHLFCMTTGTSFEGNVVW